MTDGYRMKIKVTFTEEVLGTASANKEIHRDFIASKGPNAKTVEEEIAAIGEDEVFEKGKTVLYKDKDGRPFVFDYMWRGFFKDACGSLREVPGSECSKITNYKKKIDGLVFPHPRKIYYELAGDVGELERPLRGQTAKGERVSLATSETVPDGSSMTFDIQLLVPKMRGAIIEMLDYGVLRGLGQWRNSGKGRFTYEILEESGKVVEDDDDNEKPAKGRGKKKAAEETAVAV